MNNEPSVITKTKTGTRVVVGTLLIVLGLGIVFAVFASYNPNRRARLGLNPRAVRLTRVVTPAPVESTPATPARENSAAEYCNDGFDNDSDGTTDVVDSDCGDPCDGVDNNLVLGVDEGCRAPGDPPLGADDVNCDNLDNDGDGRVDEGCDPDNDGYCQPGVALYSPDGIPVPSPYTCPNGANDCGENTDPGMGPYMNPGRPEICDNFLDEDCDGQPSDPRTGGRDTCVECNTVYPPSVCDMLVG